MARTRSQRRSDRGAIVTAAGPGLRDVLHEVALPSFRRYADAWGYDVVAHDIATDGARSDPGAQAAKWAKVGFLREALADWPAVIWFDADVLVVRTDDDILARLHPDHFQGLVLEQVPDEHRVNPNTGVWVLRSTPMAHRFLAEVQGAGQQPGPWADQGAVLKVLGWDRGDGDSYHWARPGRGSEFMWATSWMPPGWNQPYAVGRTDEESYNSVAANYVERGVVPQPHAVHFMGMTPAGRRRRMAEYARELESERVTGIEPA